MANIAQIKLQIANEATTVLGKTIEIPVLNLVRGKDGEEPNEWLSHWDNDNRVRVTMHEEVRDVIKRNDHTSQLLAVKRELVKEHISTVTGVLVPQYLRFVVITPNIEDTF